MPVTAPCPTEVSDIATLAVQLEGAGARQVLHTALAFDARIAIAFSGAEDVVLIDMALKEASAERFSVFCLDTARLHPETYRFIEQVRKHYDIDIEMLSPDADALSALVRTKGLFSFYQDGHQECCGVRKRAPLLRKLASLDIWITGQRRDQSPDTRATVPVVERDPLATPEQPPRLKFNPLATLSSSEVWSYIHAFDVPYNTLHNQGFISIGCEPCTRAVRPGEHERAGRWWWEDATKKECGLHLSAVGQSTTDDN